jgi:hypothetical protein
VDDLERGLADYYDREGETWIGSAWTAGGSRRGPSSSSCSAMSRDTTCWRSAVASVETPCLRRSRARRARCGPLRWTRPARRCPAVRAVQASLLHLPHEGATAWRPVGDRVCGDFEYEGWLDARSQRSAEPLLQPPLSRARPRNACSTRGLDHFMTWPDERTEGSTSSQSCEPVTGDRPNSTSNDAVRRLPLGSPQTAGQARRTDVLFAHERQARERHEAINHDRPH